MSLAYLYAIDQSAIQDGIVSDFRVFMDTYKQYLLLPIGGCAIALSLIFKRKKAFLYVFSG